MNIVYIHQFFATSQGSSGTRSYDVSRHLAAAGHEVTMICGTTDIGEPMPWYRLFRRERLANFDVIICNVHAKNNHGAVMRMLTFCWFAVLATIVACFFVRWPNVIFATSLPLTVGIPGFVAARRHRVPFVFEVRDIFPEGDIISGNLKANSPITKMLEALEWFCYVKADRLLLVSPGFEKRLIERGFDGSKMKSVLLGADRDLFVDVEPDKAFRVTHGLADKTVAIYTGAHGRANGLYYILDAAELLKQREDIAFVLIGDGREKPGLLDQVEKRNLINVHLLPPVPKTQLVRILPECDIGLMILADVGERPVTPNKIFDYMMSGLPSIVNFPGPTIEMVLRDEAGVYSDPKKPQELADAVAHWADDPKEAKALGLRVRTLSLKKYDRWEIAMELLETLKGASARRRDPVRQKGC